MGIVAIAFSEGFGFAKGKRNCCYSLLGALAGSLLPALQQIYSAWATLKGTSASVDAVLRMLKQDLPPSVGVVDPLPFSDGIHKECAFLYEPDQPEVLQALIWKSAVVSALA